MTPSVAAAAPSAATSSAAVVAAAPERPPAAATPAASAAQAPTDREAPASSERECQRAASFVPPSSDAPAAAELASLRGCDAEALYYGIGESVDFVKARRCAYAEEANGEGTAMGGSAVLMMTYANGQGVPRNFDLALRFACDVGGAPAELDGRVGRLVRARAAGALSEAFDVCDDITSGFMQGICTAHGERVAAVGRQARLHAATSDFQRGSGTASIAS